MKKIIFLIFAFATIQVANAQCTLDPSFGTGGIVHIPIAYENAYGYAAALQSDGKIVLAGNTGVSSHLQAVFVRLNTNGTLDNSFGDGGIVLVPGTTTKHILEDVAIQSDGKIVATGRINTGSGFSITLIRVNTDGSMDADFGSNGTVVFNLKETDVSEAILIQPDGKYLIGGYSDDNFTMIRVNTDGTLDNTFGTSGVATTNFEGSPSGIFDFALQSDGKIVAAGYYLNDESRFKFAVVRYNIDGSLDLTFGTAGKLVLSIGPAFDFLMSVCVQSDGKILLGGHTYIDFGPKYDIVVARLESNGTLDYSFGIGGYAKARIVEGENYVTDMKVQTDGKIILAGNTVSDGAIKEYDLGLVRFNSNGTLDLTFSPTGMVSTDLNGMEDYGNALLLQTDGKIVATGYSYNNHVAEFTAVRYTFPNVGMNETAGNNLSVYPNPTNNIVKIEINSKSKIEILDMLGNSVFSSFAQDQILVDVSQFSKGIYFVRASSESSYEVIKLIVE
ncbi:MAG: T9SS type A sorting domain-containing protein [Bacteroidales bacterium]|nr:T9SS type A sorting domain-containing protein [Bacteroidales bacterium]